MSFQVFEAVVGMQKRRRCPREFPKEVPGAQQRHLAHEEAFIFLRVLHAFKLLTLLEPAVN